MNREVEQIARGFRPYFPADQVIKRTLQRQKKGPTKATKVCNEKISTKRPCVPRCFSTIFHSTMYPSTNCRLTKMLLTKGPTPIFGPFKSTVGTDFTIS